MLLNRAQNLSPSTHLNPTKPFVNSDNKKPNNTITLSCPMRTSLFSSPLSLLRSVTISLSHHHHHHLHPYRQYHHRGIRFPLSLHTQTKILKKFAPISTPKCLSAFVEHLACESQSDENWDFSSENESEAFKFDDDGSAFAGAGKDLKKLDTPGVEVKELAELPEQWRRAKLAWLCKELPAHRAGALVRILNGQRKWVRQEDATFIVVHCTRIRENETGFRVVI